MPPFDKDKARQRGYTVAIAVFSAFLAVLYVAHNYLSWQLGEELSALVLAVIWLFSLALLDPIVSRFAALEARRYCSKHGHLIENKTAGDGTPYVVCSRCYTVMINERCGEGG